MPDGLRRSRPAGPRLAASRTATNGGRTRRPFSGLLPIRPLRRVLWLWRGPYRGLHSRGASVSSMARSASFRTAVCVGHRFDDQSSRRLTGRPDLAGAERCGPNLRADPSEAHRPPSLLSGSKRRAPLMRHRLLLARECGHSQPSHPVGACLRLVAVSCRFGVEVTAMALRGVPWATAEVSCLPTCCCLGLFFPPPLHSRKTERSW